MNVTDDVVVYFLHAFTRRCSCGLHTELMVESRLLLLEHSPGFVELIKVGTLPLVIVPALRGAITSRSVR